MRITLGSVLLLRCLVLPLRFGLGYFLCLGRSLPFYISELGGVEGGDGGRIWTGLGKVLIGIGRNQERLRGPPKTSSRFWFIGRYLGFT